MHPFCYHYPIHYNISSLCLSPHADFPPPTGILAGPPIAGALLQLRSHDTPSPSGEGDFFYLWAQFFGGAMLVAGAVLAFAARMACARKVAVKV